MSERIEVGNLCGNLGCAMPKMADSDYCPVCMVIAEQSPSVPPSPHDWKPEPPCQAMVEVFVKEIRGNDAVVFMGDEYPTLVPLSSIHPMTDAGRDGGN